MAFPDGKSVTLDAEPIKHSIKDTKKMVYEAEPEFKAHRIGLMFCGKPPNDNVTLQQLSLRS